jgi:hypothetical protein
MSQESDDRRTALRRKAIEAGLSDDEARELADLERGRPSQPGPGFGHRPPPDRPWQLRYWKGRSLGPIGGLIAVALALLAVAVIFVRRPAVSWSVYGDRHVGFRLDYPEDWITQDVTQGSNGGDVVGVAVTREGTLPPDYHGALAPPITQPVYGLVIFTKHPSDGAVLLRPFLTGSGSEEPTIASLGGLPGSEVRFATEGVEARTVYATDQEGRLIVFFSRVPAGEARTVQDVIEHARQSVRL